MNTNDIKNIKVFKNNISTLKETSFDKDNNTYMTEYDIPVIDFDGVKDDYIENLKLTEIPKSNDALLKLAEDKFVFIEFKNGSVKPFNVRRKIYDSTLIFTDILNIGISYMRKNVEYILVYNESKNKDSIQEDKRKNITTPTSFNTIAKTITSYSGDNYVAFGLKDFENYCFKKVYTLTEKEFEEYLKSIGL
ncbi:hypothetical protein B5E58_13135 [Tyzzerella sp. An114]|uniref:hypothetical protein n=1 Tax=Tyzzerella sp. An114 TaxID=1965545 RepID=UPI000B42F974|nr:hypothetical protein [Tyzzerella sp. An114]OUQ54216.1 hypothetical protein B5E58_13135 [Tyzzerella sp. An114]